MIAQADSWKWMACLYNSFLFNDSKARSGNAPGLGFFGGGAGRSGGVGLYNPRKTW